MKIRELLSKILRFLGFGAPYVSVSRMKVQ